MNSKIVRPCINCGAGESTPVFTYTYDFMVKVRKMTPDYMKEVGWGENVTSTIVKCNKCGCNYVRDVFPNWERKKKLTSYDEINKRFYTHSRFTGYDEENWNVRNLILIATEEHKRDIRFLDFGAGCGTAANIARIFGTECVVAYDPYGAFGHEEYKRLNFPGIIFTRNKEDLHKWAPFDIVLCQGVIEHTMDPVGELKTIYSIMPKGGYLYITNPLMDLDSEIKFLRKAKVITKNNRISHYHPGHLNHLNPKQFTRLLQDAGFEITPMVFCPPLPLKINLTNKRYLRRSAKFLIMKMIHILKIPYKRYIFIARKP